MTLHTLLDYDTLRFIWWLLIGVLLVGFAVTDGFDLGSGMLLPFAAVLTNPVAQAKFVHTVSAGYVCAAVFVLGVSAWYVLKGRHLELAKRSMTVAASFGLAAALSVAVLGD